MKRLLTLGLALVALAVAPSAASAQSTIDAVFLAEYSAPTFTIDQGEIVVFRNRDPFLEHGVVSNARAGGERRFDAGVAAPKGRRLVRGAPFLKANTYQFHCPVHPEMTATLEVSANGQPLPRDSIEPTAAVKVRTKRLGTLLERRRVRFTVNPTEAEDLAIAARAGGVKLAAVERTYVEPGRRTLVLRIRKRAAKRLRARVAQLERHDRRSLRLVVSADLADVAGNEGVATGSRRLAFPA